MGPTVSRLSPAVHTLGASVVAAQAQTSDLYLPRSVVPSPQAGMPMPNAAAQGSEAGVMGADMGRMMKTMRPMIAECGGTFMSLDHGKRRKLEIIDTSLVPWNAFADTVYADATAIKSHA